jgi:hypothetical protein
MEEGHAESCRQAQGTTGREIKILDEDRWSEISMQTILGRLTPHQQGQ